MREEQDQQLASYSAIRDTTATSNSVIFSYFRFVILLTLLTPASSSSGLVRKGLPRRHLNQFENHSQ